MKIKSKIFYVFMIVALILTSAVVLSACNPKNVKCYYTISTNLPQNVEKVYVYSNTLSSDSKGNYIEKGSDLDIIVTMANEYYNANGIKVVVNGTSYDVSPYSRFDSGRDYAVSIKAEADMNISATGTATEKTGDFIIDCPTDEEMLLYYGNSEYLLNSNQKKFIQIIFNNYDDLVALNPDKFGEGNFFSKKHTLMKNFKICLWTDL